ncbi:hypothetical protein BaRGS_00037205 [Batillaria attramentaria]|uniref:Uncharacterized protein n=1 Tax=Batillaria attramentaria TaxID=370345 RepID=A0ABD0JAB8_9CAEN
MRSQHDCQLYWLQQRRVQFAPHDWARHGSKAAGVFCLRHSFRQSPPEWARVLFAIWVLMFSGDRPRPSVALILKEKKGSYDMKDHSTLVK